MYCNSIELSNADSYGHLLATLFSGGPARGLSNALALGAGAWLSRILVSRSR